MNINVESSSPRMSQGLSTTSDEIQQSWSLFTNMTYWSRCSLYVAEDRGDSLGDEGLPEYGITPHQYQFGGCAIRGSFTRFTGHTTEIPQDTPEKNRNL